MIQATHVWTWVDLTGTPSAVPSVTCTRQRHHLQPPWSRSFPWGSTRLASSLPHFWHPGLQCRLPRNQTTTGGPWGHPLHPQDPSTPLSLSIALIDPERREYVGPYMPGTKHDGIFKYQNHPWLQSPAGDKFLSSFLSDFKSLARYPSPKSFQVTLLLQQPHSQHLPAQII